MLIQVAYGIFVEIFDKGLEFTTQNDYISTLNMRLLT